MPKHLTHIVVIADPVVVQRQNRFHFLRIAVGDHLLTYDSVPVWFMADAGRYDRIAAIGSLIINTRQLFGGEDLVAHVVIPRDSFVATVREFDARLGDRYQTVVVACNWTTQDRVRIVFSRYFPNAMIIPIRLELNSVESWMRRILNWPATLWIWARTRPEPPDRPRVMTAPAQ